MRIGLNALFWRPDGMGGTQTYLLELLSALLAQNPDDEIVVFLSVEAADRFPVKSSRVTVITSPRVARGRGMQMLWELTGFRWDVARSNVDVVHSLGYLAPPAGRVAQVVSLLDLVHYVFPQQIAPLKRRLWSWLMPSSLRRVSAIITISDSVREEMSERFPWAATKAVTVPLGVDRNRFSASTAVKEEPPFILAVALQLPHKNLDGLLRAFVRVRAARPDVTLRLAGMHTNISGRLMELVQELQLGGGVEFLGRVDDDQLVTLYHGASVMAFPSLYEGFGLPLLEAMSSGCPVVCGHRGAVREVVGEAAWITDVSNPIKFADTLLLALDKSSGLGEQMRQRGLDRADQYPWSETARRTRAVYESCIDTHRKRIARTVSSRQ